MVTGFNHPLPTTPNPWFIPLELFKRTIPASAPQDVVWNRPGISSQPGSNWSGNSVGTVWVAGTPEISETRSNIRRRNSPQSPADPWSIVINVNDHLRNGPGISQRAAAARSQTVWRWLVIQPEVVCSLFVLGQGSSFKQQASSSLTE